MAFMHEIRYREIQANRSALIEVWFQTSRECVTTNSSLVDSFLVLGTESTCSFRVPMSSSL